MSEFDLAKHKRVIIIGGPSHVGKSTLANSLSERLGWDHVSTDMLARYPGRPWKPGRKTVPERIARHYLSMSVHELFEDVLRHYRSMWPDIEALVTLHATDLSRNRLVIEGSALWPITVAKLSLPEVGAIWLTASNELLQTRIYNESRFEEIADRERAMVGKFLGRAHVYNRRMVQAVIRLGLASIDVETASSLDELSDETLKLINSCN